LREEDRGALEEPTDVERTLGASATVAWAFGAPRIVPALRWTVLQDHPVLGDSVVGWELGAAFSWRFGAQDLVTVLGEYDLAHREGEEALHRGLAELRIVL
jgi:hypothetical protein